jgi:hypothetical protein
MNERRPENRMVLSPIETKSALALAEKLLKERFPKIDERDFADVYGQAKVDEAVKTVEEIKKGFANKKDNVSPESMARGKIFEAVVLDLVQLWFPNVKLTRASDTDDFVNKVDSILTKKVNPEKRAIGVSLDPTTSFLSLQDKESRIRAKDGLTNIDFFQDQDDDFKGGLPGVPLVALYLNDETFSQLLRLWYNVHVGKISETLKTTLKNQLINHEAQIDFLKQIIYQLELTASKLKTKNNLNNAELVGLGTIADYLKTFKTIMSAKEVRLAKH